MNVPNVKLYFKTGDAGSDSILAPNQHVYIDIDPKAPGVMRLVRSDSAGTIVMDASSPAGAASPASKSGSPAVALDDSRTYNVVVSASPLGSVPSVGTPTKVTAGKL